MNPTKFALVFENTSDAADLGISVTFDDQYIFNQTLSKGTHNVKWMCETVEKDCQLCINFFGKTHEHTTIDVDGNIINDSTIQLTSFFADDVDVLQILFENSVYKHSNNTDQDIQEHPFYGTFGCNGFVEAKMRLPVYQWLLDCM